jgi:hypothetical protein
MRTTRTTIACVALMVGVASSGRAHGADEPSSPSIPSRTIPIDTLYGGPTLSPSGLAERADLKRWMDEFARWLEWSGEWRNVRQRGWFTQFRERPQKPLPPPWLGAQCDRLLDDADPLIPACSLLAKWRNDVPTTQVQPAPAVAKGNEEDSRRTLWWEYVHADVLWPALQWEASVYGVIGVHTAMTIRGRLEIFTAPGAMLLNVPENNGTRIWKLAMNYGIGYRLLDFTFPGHRAAVLHLNLAKAWLLSDISDVATGRSMDFVGFSITFNRSR